MNRWLERLKNENATREKLTRPTKAPPVSFVSAPRGDNQNFQAEKSENENSTDTHHSILTEPTKGVDVFNLARRLPAGVVVALPDLDRPGRWIARRAGSLEPEGTGEDQLSAVLDLERREAIKGERTTYERSN